MEYVATNIRLPRQTLQELKLRAVRRNRSMAQLIREAVDQVYGEPKAKPRSLKESRKDPIFSIVGIWCVLVKPNCLARFVRTVLS